MSVTEVAVYQAGTCQISFAGEKKCTAPAASTWEAGCVHEHVTPDVEVCAAHEPQMTLHRWMCVVCEQGDKPHKCPVVVRKAEAGQ